MRRGQRKLWREVAEAATLVATSENYAQEYVYGALFRDALNALAATRAPEEPKAPKEGTAR